MGRLVSRIVHDESLSAITADTTTNLNPYMDLSHAEAITVEVVITAAATAVGDILSVSLEDTIDGTYWNTRIRFEDLLGNMTEPEIRRATIHSVGADIASTEEYYETTDSTGATEIAKGSVVNGPFPGICRTASGPAASWRLVYDVTSASSPSFTGTCKVIATSRI